MGKNTLQKTSSSGRIGKTLRYGHLSSKWENQVATNIMWYMSFGQRERFRGSHCVCAERYHAWPTQSLQWVSDTLCIDHAVHGGEDHYGMYIKCQLFGGKRSKAHTLLWCTAFYLYEHTKMECTYIFSILRLFQRRQTGYKHLCYR